MLLAVVVNTIQQKTNIIVRWIVMALSDDTKKDVDNQNNTSNDEPKKYDKTVTLEADAARKVHFILTVLITSILLSTGVTAMIAFMVLTIGGKFVLVPWLETFFENKIKKPFLILSKSIWTKIVIAYSTLVFVITMISAAKSGDFWGTLLPALGICVAAGFIFAGKTEVVYGPDEPNRRGSAAWKDANGIERVYCEGSSWLNPVYRDKNGNYYKGRECIPIPPPVEVIIKK